MQNAYANVRADLTPCKLSESVPEAKSFVNSYDQGIKRTDDDFDVGIAALQGPDSDADGQSEDPSDGEDDSQAKVDARQLKAEIREAQRSKRRKQRLADDDEQQIQDSRGIFDSSLVEEDQKKRKRDFESDDEDDGTDIVVFDHLGERTVKPALKQSIRTYGPKGAPAFVAPDSRPEDSVSTSASKALTSATDALFCLASTMACEFARRNEKLAQRMQERR